MSSDETMTAGAPDAPAAQAPAAASPAGEPGTVSKPVDAASSEEAPAKATRTRRPRAPKKTDAAPSADGADAASASAPASDQAASKPSSKTGADAPADAASDAPAEKPARAKRAPRARKAAVSDAPASRDTGAEAEGGKDEARDAAVSADAALPASAASEQDVKPGRATRTPRSRAARAKKAEIAEGAEGSSASEPSQQIASAQDDSSIKPESGKGDAVKTESARSESGKGEYSRGSSARQDKSERYDKQSRQDRNGKNGKGGKQQRDQRGNQRQQNQGQDHRRQRRTHMGGNSNREPIVPKTTAEDLSALKVAELRAKADELGVDSKGLKKAELVERVLEASVRAEGFIEVSGVLDIMQDGYGFLRTGGYLPGENDVYVGLSLIRRNGLRKGDFIRGQIRPLDIMQDGYGFLRTGGYLPGENDVYVGLSLIRRNGLRKGDFIRGQIRPKRDNEKFAALQQIATVNDVALDQLGQRVRFGDLTPIYPDECLVMEHGKTTITARVIDLVAPIGKGQRGLIVSPPKAGKTTILKDIAAAITANNSEVHLMCLLVDERPEEVTDMERSIKGEVISSTFDMPPENHITVAELVIERAKRLVECGKDVVILLDSLTRLARAYNLAQPASGRILSGGVDSTALYPPKRFLGAARNIEGGGSLTILASALIETGSKMDEVIFEEFKGTGNMELKLDRYLADRRIFPAIDPVASGTRKEDLLLNPQEAPLIWAVRRILSNMNNTERAMDMLIKSLKQTSNNQEFLLRTAKKAQTSRDSDNFEF